MIVEFGVAGLIKYGATILGVLMADRFLLKRNQVKILRVSQIKDAKAIRFALDFKTRKAINKGRLYYEIRNKKHPTAVITKERLLDFSNSTLISEFLVFDKAELEQEAGESIHGQEWIVNVKIERSCSLVNPLYKYFPMTATYTEEFNIE